MSAAPATDPDRLGRHASARVGFAAVAVARDATGRVLALRRTDADPRFEALVGLARGSAAGTDLDMLFAPAAARWIVEATAQGPVRIERETEGPARWLDVTVLPIGRDAMAVLLDDITARKAAECRMRESEERQAFLVRFSDALRELDDPLAVQREASRLLCTHLRAHRVLFAELEDGDAVVLLDHVDGVRSLAGRHPLHTFSDASRSAYGRGDTFAVVDVSADERISPAGRERLLGDEIGALVGVGLRGDGDVSAVLAVHQRTPRAWSADEIALVRESGERTWAAVARARAEAGRLHSEQRLAAIFASASVGLSEVDANGSFVQVNDELCRILGRPHAALVGHPIASITHPDDLPATRDAVARAFAEHCAVSLDKRYLRPDGSVVWANSRATPLHSGDGATGSLLVVTIDLTERRAAEAAREASEWLLRQFSEASSDVLWIRDADSLRWEYLSPAYAVVYGDSLEAALDDNGVSHWTDRILEDDREHAMRCIDRVRAGESIVLEYRIRRVSDGAVRWIRDTDFPLLGADGRVQRIGGIGHDVTDLKQTEAALAESEDRQRRLVQGIPQLVWRSDPRGACTWVRPQWQMFTGQDAVDALGPGWTDVVHPDDRTAAADAVRRALPSGRIDVELRLRRADGTYVWHHVRSSPRVEGNGDGIGDGDGNGHGGRIVEWLGTCTDVQQLKELQQQQQVLVAELQHRTRNLIAVVCSIAERISSSSSSVAEFRARFRDRMGALARVQGLLSQRDAGQRISFDQLLQAELAGLGVLDRLHDGRIELDGPADVRLRSATVQTFALGVHELATNALKYGALSAPGGHLAVHWCVEGEPDAPVLCVHWRETGVEVPPALLGDGAPRGYGRELIERALPYQLQAKTRYVLRPDGVDCTLRVPLSGPDGAEP